MSSETVRYEHRAVGIDRESGESAMSAWFVSEGVAERRAAELRFGRVETVRVVRTPHRTRDVPPARSPEGEAASGSGSARNREEGTQDER